MKKVLALLFAALMVFSCFACNTQGPAEEFELNVNIASEPESIDPALNTAVDGAVMINHMFEGLYKWIDDGNGVAKLVLGQAESVDVNAEKTVYTFKIRENAKWSDGQAVTASDFVYSWQRLVDPATAADYCYMADILLNANEIMAGEKDKSELGVKAIDEHTLEVTLHTPCPYFEEIMAFPSLMPVRQDMIEKGGDQWTFDLSTYVGNGPYKMESWEHNSKIRELL